MAGQEVIYLRNLLHYLGSAQNSPTKLWEDNTACVTMSENPSNPERSQHIDTRRWFLREMVRDGLLKLLKVKGTENVADAFTKSLPAPSFVKHREYIWGSKKPFQAFHSRIVGFPALKTSGG